MSGKLPLPMRLYGALLTFISLCCFSITATAQSSQIITKLAGEFYWGDGGPATDANLKLPHVVVLDASGNFYISDDSRIRRVSPSGTITTLAGNDDSGFSGDGGLAINAQLNSPTGVLIDANGNLYFCDTGNSRIRKIDNTGIITTVAGTGNAGYSGDNGAASSAQLNQPGGLALDANGNLYFCDTGNSRLRKIDNTGIITTIAGTGSAGYGGDNGAATSAQLNIPLGIALDASGNLYVADAGNNCIRKIDNTGTITTVAGNGTAGYSGDNGPATSAQLSLPFNLVVDANNNLFIADYRNNRIRKVDNTGIITTVAGNGTAGYSGDNGPATSAQIWVPYSVTIDASGNLYACDLGNRRIRKIDNTGTITTVAGSDTKYFGGDGGPAINAQIYSPAGMATDAAGNVYIADNMNNRVRKISPSGIISTVAGTGDGGYNGDGIAATSAQLKFPRDVAVDASGNLYICDTGNNRIRKVDNTGIISTVAGNGTSSSSDGVLATTTGLGTLAGIALDGSGNLYLSDINRIRKVDNMGILTTIAGTVGRGSAAYSGDNGLATSAKLNTPAGLAVDASGNLFIADSFNNRIRRIDNNGIITTVAGTGKAGFSGDGGPANSAALLKPTRVCLDASGNLYVSMASIVRKVTPNGTISTIVGYNSGPALSSDYGQLAVNAPLSTIAGIAIDGAQNLYLTDSDLNKAFKVTPPATLTGLAASTPACVGSPVTVTAAVVGLSGTYDFTLTNGTDRLNGSTDQATISQNWTPANAGSYTFTLIVSGNIGIASATTSLTINPAPSVSLKPASATLTCSSPTVSLTVNEAGTYHWDDNSTNPVRVVSTAGTYSLTLTDGAGCMASTSTTVYSNTLLVTSATASLSAVPVGTGVAMTATGGDTYLWSAPDNAQFTTSANSPDVSATMSVAGPQVFTVVISQGGCSQTQLVSVTATNGPDLSPVVTLPDANFPVNGSKDFVIRIFEVGWVATSPNSVSITVTAPLGYSLVFNPTLTSTNVAGGVQNPVAVNNTDWLASSDPAGQQLQFWLKPGSWIGGGSQSVLGLTLVRAGANSGSVSNLTLNVADDLSKTFDINTVNNIYVRILNGL